MHSYIIIHHTHEIFEVALFINNAPVSIINDNKRLTSKMLVPFFDSLLKENSFSLANLSFIGVNQGPGLFSTLRSIIATVNALHFSSDIPLIGVDALETTTYEFYDETYPHSVTLLDAFNHEVYYAITSGNIIIKKGYAKIDLFLQDLMVLYPSQKIRFIGRGTQLYKNLIVDICREQTIIPENIPDLCSLNSIAKGALDLFVRQKYNNGYLFPLYLKKHPVELL